MQEQLFPLDEFPDESPVRRKLKTQKAQESSHETTPQETESWLPRKKRKALNEEITQSKASANQASKRKTLVDKSTVSKGGSKFLTKTERLRFHQCFRSSSDDDVLPRPRDFRKMSSVIISRPSLDEEIKCDDLYMITTDSHLPTQAEGVNIILNNNFDIQF